MLCECAINLRMAVELGGDEMLDGFLTFCLVVGYGSLAFFVPTIFFDVNYDGVVKTLDNTLKQFAFDCMVSGVRHSWTLHNYFLRVYQLSSQRISIRHCDSASSYPVLVIRIPPI